MHGIIQNGALVVVGKRHAGAKPVVYEEVPDFDQELYYVTQQPPIDAGNHIFMGVEIREMAIDDEDYDA